MTIYILIGVITWLILSIILNNREHRKDKQALHDTIQKLLNREPVTYKEVGTKPPKPENERYSAWGSQMIDKEEK